MKPTPTVALLLAVIGCSLLGTPAHAGSVARTDPFGCFQTEPSKAFVSKDSSSAQSSSRLWRFTSRQSCALLGESVAAAGDVNGDGFDDIIVGSQWFDVGQYDEGEAFAFYGSPSGPDTNVDWMAHGDKPASNFASSVAGAGDVNGDGYDDVIVGQATEFGVPGSAFAFLGSPSGLSLTSAWTAGIGHVGDEFGTSVATAGDVNGDGYDDVIVGAPGFDDGLQGQGAAFVYLGSPSGLATTAAWTAKGDEQSDFYGNSVSTAGDVNGDGFDDVIVGARLYDGGQHDEGRAFVYLGSASGLSDTATWMAEGNQASAQLGWSVATAGDVNTDGYDDVIVGAPFYSNGQIDEGRAFVYLGSATGLGTTAAWTDEGNQPGVHFGHSVRLAGDVNGDGYGDVTIGVPFFEGGIVLIVPGSATGPQTGARGIVDGPNGELGFSAGAAGDPNGDGFGDVIAGAPLFSRLGKSEEGAAMITLGRSG